MKRKRIFGLAIVLALAILFWVLALPDKFGICPEYGDAGWHQCVLRYDGFAPPFALLVSSIFTSFLIAIFTKELVFRAWGMFSIAFVVFATFLLLLTPEIAPSLVSFDREQIAWLLSILYVVISIVIIAYKSWRIKA